jgi:hypothetical protein
MDIAAKYESFMICSIKIALIACANYIDDISNGNMSLDIPLNRGRDDDPITNH